MRHRFVHVASVARQPATTENLQRVKGLRTVHPRVACLIEPRPSIETPSQMGRISQGDHLMSWGTEDIKASDVVTWGGRNFTVKRVIRDTARPFSSVPPYHVAELLEVVT